MIPVDFVRLYALSDFSLPIEPPRSRIEIMENTSKLLFRDDSPQWYVAVGKKGVGPMTAAELYEKINRGHLTWVDFGWRKGQKTWQRLCDLDELKSLLPSQPAQDLQRQVQKSADSQASSPAEGAERVVTRASARSSKTSVSPTTAGGPPQFAGGSAEPKIWYLHYNSSQYGPFSQKEILRAIEIGKINSNIHAWSNGMAGWEKIGKIATFQKAGSRPEATRTPERTEKRETPRRPMVAQVLMSDEETVIVGVCRDISIGGLQVLTDRAPAPVGSKLKMNISPSGDVKGQGFQPFVAEGVVVRILEDERGFSFRFSKLSDAARRSIEDYIESDE